MAELPTFLRLLGNRGQATPWWHQTLDRKWKYGRFAHAQWKICNIALIYGQIAKIVTPQRKLGSRDTMVTSDFRPEVEIRPFRACTMHPVTIIGTVRSLWTWLLGRYHVPQNAFLVLYNFVCRCSEPWRPPRPMLSWSTPRGCQGSACTYRAEWSLDVATDIITFTIAARQDRNRWTGIAFAPEPRMVLQWISKLCVTDFEEFAINFSYFSACLHCVQCIALWLRKHVSVCLTVCPLHSDVLSRRIKIRYCGLQCQVAQWVYCFWKDKVLPHIRFFYSRPASERVIRGGYRERVYFPNNQP